MHTGDLVDDVGMLGFLRRSCLKLVIFVAFSSQEVSCLRLRASEFCCLAVAIGLVPAIRSHVKDVYVRRACHSRPPLVELVIFPASLSH